MVETHFISYLRHVRVTFFLVITNAILFIINFLEIGANDSILLLGANFAPLTLSSEPYRLFTSLFLHDGYMHIIFNMYGLLYLGFILETEFGPKKMLEIYLFSGIIGSLFSVSYNLFTVSVGASGAILGLYGYNIINTFIKSDIFERPAIVINFVLYVIFLLLTSTKLNIDNAAHLGGLLTGIVICVIDNLYPQFNSKYKLALAAAFTLTFYLIIPRYQVKYYDTFQYFLQKEEYLVNKVFKAKISNEQRLSRLQLIRSYPDSVKYQFSQITGLPYVLKKDIEKINKYLYWRRKEFAYIVKEINTDSFFYHDSVEYVISILDTLPRTRYFPMLYPIKNEEDNESDKEKLIPSQQYYNEAWTIVDSLSDYKYYRLGFKDSLGNWHSIVNDFYKNGKIQMRGVFNRGLKDGLFVFYHENGKCRSGGRYKEDFAVGKWEYYYSNGQIKEQREWINERLFIKNIWDSTGRKMVENGEGKYETYYPDGQLRYVSELIAGRREGYVYGYKPDGSLHFKEYFEDNKLIKGISYGEDGSLNEYDASTYFPTPIGGYDAYYKYIKDNKKITYGKSNNDIIRLQVEIDKNGEIAEVVYLNRLGEPFDSKAKELILNGPKWIAAKEHGYIPINSEEIVYVKF